jgi:hypothetical protein
MLLLRRRLFTLFSQRKEIVSLFVQQTFANQPFDDIKHSRARVGIVSAGFEQFMKIERFFAPVRKAT